MNNVKNSIGWADWTLNPVKGLCPVACPYCYARRAYGRNCNEVFRDKTIRYDVDAWSDVHKAKDTNRIFVGSTIDLFHPLCSKWNNEILETCESFAPITFIFLTKCPENLPKEFPDNCWVGVSATNKEMFDKLYTPSFFYLKSKVKFISFEPLLKPILSVETMSYVFKQMGIKWVIIGAQTPYSIKTAPKIEWVKEIIDASDKAKIPVFLKDNLINTIQSYKINPYPAWAYKKGIYRQEFPVVK